MSMVILYLSHAPRMVYRCRVAISSCSSSLTSLVLIKLMVQFALTLPRTIANGPAPPFFAACAGAAYTYPIDDKANVSNLSPVISCCIGTLCEAPPRQPHHLRLRHRNRHRRRRSRDLTYPVKQMHRRSQLATILHLRIS